VTSISIRCARGARRRKRRLLYALVDERLALTALSFVIVSTCLWTKVHWILRVELQSILFRAFSPWSSATRRKPGSPNLSTRHCVATRGDARSGVHKTDVFTLENGDRLTGEIIQLELGRLEIKTDAIGTVYIECPKVSGLAPANACSSTIPSGFSSKTFDYGQFSVRWNPIPIGE
jgi:hypothetical protein